MINIFLVLINEKEHLIKMLFDFIQRQDFTLTFPLSSVVFLLNYSGGFETQYHYREH
jgi:hypothetical protein